MHIAQNITATCKKQGVTVKSMTSACGLGVNCIANMTRGSAISAVSLARIADYLGVSVDYLLGRVGEPEEHYRRGIAQNIAETCRTRGLTVEELLTACGLPARALDRAQGEDLSALDLARISARLDVPADKLLKP